LTKPKPSLSGKTGHLDMIAKPPIINCASRREVLLATRSIQTSYRDIRDQIPHGALLLYRGRWWHPVDRLIMAYGRSPYVHSAMAAVVDMAIVGRLKHLEVVQCGRRKDRVRYLSNVIAQHPGRIDVYEPRPTVAYACGCNYSPDQAVAEMYTLCYSARYGWWDIFRMARWMVPGRRLFLAPDTDDTLQALPWYICTAASSHCYQTGGMDPVPNLATRSTGPGDLSRSLFFKKLFERLIP